MKLDIIYHAPKTMLKTSEIWPEHEELEEFDDYSFTDFISTLQVNTILADNNLMIRIGDSNNIAHVTGMILQDENGRKELNEMASTFAEAIRTSISDMSNDYRKFYEDKLKEFDKNGYHLDLPTTVVR